MFVVAQKLTIGFTRDQGFLLFNTETTEFLEYSTSEVKRMLKKGGCGVCGLKLVNNEIVLDEDGFNQDNILVKSSMSMGKFRPLKPNGKLEGGRMYSVVRAVDTPDEGLIYEVISNTCSRTLLKESGIRRLYDNGLICGLWVDKTTGQITLAEQIPIIDVGELGGEKVETKEEKQDATHGDSDISDSDLHPTGSITDNDDACNDKDIQSAVLEESTENKESNDNLVFSETSNNESKTLNPFDEIDQIEAGDNFFDSLDELVVDNEDPENKEQDSEINKDMSQVGDSYLEREDNLREMEKKQFNKEDETEKETEDAEITDEVVKEETTETENEPAETTNKKKPSKPAAKKVNTSGNVKASKTSNSKKKPVAKSTNKITKTKKK